MAEEFGRVLVLGGIRSGKSEYAEELLARAPQVTFLATGPASEEESWAARVKESSERRPEHWVTEEVGTDLVAAFESESVLLVDDVGSWLSRSFDAVRWQEVPDVSELISAVEGRRGPLVLVSPEAGLSTNPVTEPGRMFADTLGSLNRRLAEICDGVVLVVAGAPIWLKGTPPSRAALSRRHRPAPIRTHPTPGIVVRGVDLTELPDPLNLEDLPRPDEQAREAAGIRLETLDVRGRGLGKLTDLVLLAAEQQESSNPDTYADIRLILFNSIADPRPARGEGIYPLLADRSGVRLEIVELAGDDADPAHTDILTTEIVDHAIDRGRALVDRAVDSGADMVILGTVADNAVACAEIVSIVVGSEPSEILSPVVVSGGRVDDNEWMNRCEVVRESLLRVRARARDPKTLLAMLGGTELAMATGIILGAAERRTPIVIDGPLGMTAALLARELAAPSRYWLRLWDEGSDPLVKLGADVLDICPAFNLKLDLGEGANALAALPLMQTALVISTSLTSELTPTT